MSRVLAIENTTGKILRYYINGLRGYANEVNTMFDGGIRELSEQIYAAALNNATLCYNNVWVQQMSLLIKPAMETESL